MKSCRLCKEDYQEIKQRLSMRQVAEHYGIRENWKHLCACPFHKDQHPSMKIYPDDKGFYCFSCGKGGDVITFLAALYGLKNEEAARKLIEDFSLPIKLENLSFRELREREKRIRRRKQLGQFQREAYAILKVYWMLLCDALHDFRDPHFAEAAQQLTMTEYRLDCLDTDTAAYYADREAVKKLGEIRDRIINWHESD